MPRTFSPRLTSFVLLFFLATGVLLFRRLQPSTPLSAPSFKRSWNCTSSSSSPQRRVAIIGAGSAGSSAAYYLREFGGPCYDLRVDVFERNTYVGGRSTTVDVFGDPKQPAELGASIFVQVNHNLVSAAERFGLVNRSAGALSLRKDDDEDDGGDADRFGVWDGGRFVFVQPANEAYWRTVLRMLWKYGLSPVRTQALMRETVGRFLQLYDAPHFPFASLSEAVYEVGLTNVTAQRGSEYLKANGIAPPFSTDLIQASTRVNYAQNLEQIHGLETMVCMATDGAMAIEGGNWRIFDAMLTHADAHVHLGTEVKEIRRVHNGTFEVHYTDALDNEVGTVASAYDDVILAAPYQYADLKLPTDVKHVPDKIDYVRLHVTLVTTPHRLHPHYFGVKSRSEIPGTVLTTLPDNAESADAVAKGKGPRDFLSISTLDVVTNPHTHRKEYLYKIFSPAPVSASLLRRLFLGEALQTPSSKGDGVTSWKYEKIWNSYPYLPPRVTFEEPVIAPGLWYTAGIESFISTMETSSLMGMNVARLAVERWQEADRSSLLGKSKDEGTGRIDFDSDQGLWHEGQREQQILTV